MMMKITLDENIWRRVKRSLQYRAAHFLGYQEKPGFFRPVIRRILSGILQDMPFYIPLTLPITFHGYETSGGYDQWCQTRERRVVHEYRIIHRRNNPLFSILVPVCDPEPEWLIMCINSVLSQGYSGWELIICDDGSLDQKIIDLLVHLEKTDKRIHVKTLNKRSGISAATNHAAKTARAGYLFFLDHDDVLPPYALAAFAQNIAQCTGTDASIFYADEDRFDKNLIRMYPGFKPQFSPDKLMATNYIHHPLVISRSLFESLGGFNSKFDGSQDHDLLLRAIEKNHRVHHIPDVLYHMRIHQGSLSSGPAAKPYAHKKDKKLIEAALERRKIAGFVDMSACDFSGYNRIVRTIKDPVEISVIILKHSRAEKKQLDAAWHGCECLVDDLAQSDTTRLNQLVLKARGDILVFADPDLLPIPGWQEQLVPHVLRTNIGLVTGKLVYADGQLHSCGLAGGMAGSFGRWHHGLDANHPGYGGWMALDHEVMAVPKQFMAIRKKLLIESGLFNTGLKKMGYDIDLALRLNTQQNKRHLAIPGCRLVFEKNYSKLSAEPWNKHDFRTLWTVWGNTIEQGDPYLNPNISLLNEGICFIGER